MLLAFLIGMAFLGVASMAAVDMWSMAAQREREQQLLFVGEQYRRAIRAFYLGAPPGTPRTLPRTFDDLLRDPRYPMPVRHLRRLYPDPITGSRDWGELRVAGGIAGVYSLSEAMPAKQAGFGPAYESFNGRTRYRDWVFSPAGTIPTTADFVPGAGEPQPATNGPKRQMTGRLSK